MKRTAGNSNVFIHVGSMTAKCAYDLEVGDNEELNDGASDLDSKLILTCIVTNPPPLPRPL